MPPIYTPNVLGLNAWNTGPSKWAKKLGIKLELRKDLEL
jgi:hypothetical protein